ncbi:DUF262 domain-containing HNH endonuclease family protein [Actinosynnema sp. NPDC023587]|uniref:DUF262 domain-containing protein n=1 Tax=Actinosynnema sp. NPDC023587 TaxID=3154695 RepID=UPI0033FCF01E
MASTKIQAAERPIGDVFSDDYRFIIPRYQRPYAWTTEQAGEMFDDLMAAASTGAPLDVADPYFLGSIVLVKAENDAEAEVVDGQQRLTTLTLLLSALRLHVADDFATSLDGRVFQKGDPIKGTIDQPRLTLRERDHGFFEKYVQAQSGVEQLPSLATDKLPDSQGNLVRNTVLFLNRLAELDREDCHRLVSFIDRNTYLVVVSTQDFESAYRIFTVLNERGLDLTHTDILKSEIIGAIAEPDQDVYTKKWESEEEDLGRVDFADLFSHIRMVFAKTKARESILKEFRSSVLSQVPDGCRFVDEVLVPLSDAFEVVTRVDYKAATGADAVNGLLRWLNMLDNTDWIPPAIRYLSDPAIDTATFHQFLVDLERLAASMLIRRVDITRRVERYGRVLESIETGVDLYGPGSPLQLDGNERNDTLRRLGDEIYTVTRIRLYVLLRLDSALSSGGASYDHPLITVEHVLPQTPSADSTWRSWFTNEEHGYWVHRLANLTLLARRKNSQASNYDFDIKKRKYFTAKNGVSPFALTSQVLTEQQWTPELLEHRQRKLLSTLADLWRLK